MHLNPSRAHPALIDQAKGAALIAVDMEQHGSPGWIDWMREDLSVTVAKAGCQHTTWQSVLDAFDTTIDMLIN